MHNLSKALLLLLAGGIIVDLGLAGDWITMTIIVGIIVYKIVKHFYEEKKWKKYVSEITQETESERIGREFKEYVMERFYMLTDDEDRNMLPEEKNRHFTLINRKNEKSVRGVSAKDRKHPELEVGFWLNKKQHIFAVECKYRRKWSWGFPQRKVKIAETLKNYKEYKDKQKIKTFLVLGLMGEQKTPQNMYVIPLDNLENLNKNELTFEQLKPYRQPNKDKYFYYCTKEETLFFK